LSVPPTHTTNPPRRTPLCMVQTKTSRLAYNLNLLTVYCAVCYDFNDVSALLQ